MGLPLFWTKFNKVEKSSCDGPQLLAALAHPSERMNSDQQTLQHALQLIEKQNAEKQQLRDLYEKSVGLVKHLNQEKAALASQLSASIEAREDLQRDIEAKQREWAAELERKADQFDALQKKLQSPMETEELRMKMLHQLEDTNESKEKVGILERQLLACQQQNDELQREKMVAVQKLRHQSDTVRALVISCRIDSHWCRHGVRSNWNSSIVRVRFIVSNSRLRGSRSS